jgi:hypothetical protein
MNFLVLDIIVARQHHRNSAGLQRNDYGPLDVTHGTFAAVLRYSRLITNRLPTMKR